MTGVLSGESTSESEVVEDRGEQQVGDDERDDGEDYRAGGGDADALRAACDGKSKVTGEAGDQRAEDAGLDQSSEEVLQLDGAERVLEVHARPHAEEGAGDSEAAR